MKRLKDTLQTLGNAFDVNVEVGLCFALTAEKLRYARVRSQPRPMQPSGLVLYMPRAVFLKVTTNSSSDEFSLHGDFSL